MISQNVSKRSPTAIFLILKKIKRNLTVKSRLILNVSMNQNPKKFIVMV